MPENRPAHSDQPSNNSPVTTEEETLLKRPKPASPTELSLRLADSHAPELIPNHKIKNLLDDPEGTTSEGKKHTSLLSRRNFLGGLVASALAATGLGVLANLPTSATENPDEKLKPKSPEEARQRAVNAIIVEAFGGKVGPIDPNIPATFTYPDVNKFVNPDRTTPKGDLAWTIKFGLPPTNANTKPWDAYVVIEPTKDSPDKIKQITISMTASSIIPSPDDQPLSDKELSTAFETLFDNPQSLNPQIKPIGVEDNQTIKAAIGSKIINGKPVAKASVDSERRVEYKRSFS